MFVLSRKCLQVLIIEWFTSVQIDDSNFYSMGVSNSSLGRDDEKLKKFLVSLPII